MNSARRCHSTMVTTHTRETIFLHVRTSPSLYDSSSSSCGSSYGCNPWKPHFNERLLYQRDSLETVTSTHGCGKLIDHCGWHGNNYGNALASFGRTLASCNNHGSTAKGFGSTVVGFRDATASLGRVVGLWLPQ